MAATRDHLGRAIASDQPFLRLRYEIDALHRQFTATGTYTEDGELPVDNNVSERTVKMQAIGRKN